MSFNLMVLLLRMAIVPPCFFFDSTILGMYVHYVLGATINRYDSFSISIHFCLIQKTHM